MGKKFTIYLNGDSPNTVLLECGAWMNQTSVNQRHIYNPERDGDGIVMHRPKLFATKGGALNHLKTKLGLSSRYRIAVYTGPIDPNERPAIVH